MNSRTVKIGVQVVFIVAMIIAGAVRIAAGDVASGSSFLIAGLGVVTVASIGRRRKRRRAEEREMVLYDERDVMMAGKAALFTVRVTLFILSGVMLVTFAVNPDWEIPVIFSLGIVLFLSSALLRVSYLIYRRQ